MIGRRRLLAGGGLAAASGAAAMPPGAQLIAAGAAIALLGLPHGASDLALVPSRRHLSFLLSYLATVATVIALWQVAPTAGLVALLVLSVIHFAVDVPADADGLVSWGWGFMLVGGPAVLHHADLAVLFQSLIGSVLTAEWIATVLHATGLAGLGLIAARWLQGKQRIDEPLIVGLACLLFLPPLIGFASGFILIHACPQLEERQYELGCVSLAGYLRQTAPVMIGAIAVIVGIGLAFAAHPSAPIAILFAAIAALATPHMIVTPLWRRPVHHLLRA